MNVTGLCHPDTEQHATEKHISRGRGGSSLKIFLWLKVFFENRQLPCLSRANDVGTRQFHFSGSEGVRERKEDRENRENVFRLLCDLWLIQLNISKVHKTFIWVSTVSIIIFFYCDIKVLTRF